LPAKDKPIFILAFDGLNPEYFEFEHYLYGPAEKSGILRSVRPWTSAPAWTSFLTGVQPEEHGVRGLYPPVPPSQWQTPPLWETSGKTFALYNMPCVKPLNRNSSLNVVEFVGGLFWEDDEEYTHPQALKDDLQEQGYRVDHHHIGDWARLKAGIDCKCCENGKCCWDCPEMRKYSHSLDKAMSSDTAFCMLMESVNDMRLIKPVAADVVFVCYTFVDRAAHRFWHDADKRALVYERVRDEINYWLVDRDYADSLLYEWLIISDHGVGNAGGPHSPHCFNGVWASEEFNLAGLSIADVLPTILEVKP
jgi:hypothetical protein